MIPTAGVLLVGEPAGCRFAGDGRLASGIDPRHRAVGDRRRFRGGRGVLEVQRVAGRSVTTRVYATSPLKLLAPRGIDPAAVVYASTYGGGLVAGDRIGLRVRVGASAVCVLGTQASTKVYRSDSGRGSRVCLTASIGDGGSLAVVPDPVTCFAGAVFGQSQRFGLHRNGSLLLIDTLTSGRMARGERWAFSQFRSRTDVYIDRRLVFTDALLLDPLDGPIAAPNRMGRFNCMATVVMIGPKLSDASEQMMAQVNAVPLGADAPLLGAASRFKHGVVSRVMGATTESVERFLRSTVRLPTAPTGAGDTRVIGQPLWGRKW